MALFLGHDMIGFFIQLQKDLGEKHYYEPGDEVSYKKARNKAENDFFDLSNKTGIQPRWSIWLYINGRDLDYTPESNADYINFINDKARRYKTLNKTTEILNQDDFTAWLKKDAIKQVELLSKISYKYKIGDQVIWKNEGHNMGVRTIIGFEAWNNKPAYYIEPHDAYWFPIREEYLTPASPNGKA